MIPRRRIPIDLADLRDFLRAPFVSARQSAADVTAFESAFARHMGTRFARAVASGRDALGLILDALDLQPGDEVIIPAYTLGELLPLLQRRGLKLRAADIDPHTMNVTPESVRERLGPNTRAILVVHLLGAPCDIEALCAIASEAGVALIEDCAHAPGARVGGRPVGSFGQAALFSLEATKAVAAFGGGVVVSSDPALFARIEAALATRTRREWPAMKKAAVKWSEELLVRSPLYSLMARILFSAPISAAFERFYRGANDRVRSSSVAFSGFQARIALRRLEGLDARNQRLNQVWNDTAARLPGRLSAQRRDACGSPAFYNLVATFDGDVRALRAAALAKGIDLGILGEVMDDTAAMLGTGNCPQVARVYPQAVLLPLYAGLSEARRERMLATLNLLAERAP